MSAGAHTAGLTYFPSFKNAETACISNRDVSGLMNGGDLNTSEPFLVAQTVKNLNAGDLGLIPGLGRKWLPTSVYFPGKFHG